MTCAHVHIPPSAVLMIAGAVACFSVTDGIVKALVVRYPVPLVVWARWGFQVLAMVLWLAPKMGRGMLRTRQLRLQLVRGCLLVCSSMLFMTALKYLPLADATALNYTTPAIVVVLAIAFLGERLTLPRMAFVFAGLAGMLLAAIGLLGTVGHFLFILAFQRAPASALTPFTYLQVVFATLIGWLVFSDFPDALTLIGMAIIAGSGLLLTWHERRRALIVAPEPTALD